MGKTVLEPGSPSKFFLDQLHQAGLSDRDIDGSVADDAVGGPRVGICRVGEPKDGKVEKSEVFAVAFNNLVKHGETIKRYFQKLGLNEVEHLRPDGTFEPAYHQSVRGELLGTDPQRSLGAWPNPKKLSKQDPGYAAALVQWAGRHTRLPLLPYKEQVAVLKELGLEEAQVKGELGKLWKGQTLPKMMAHASVLRGEELLAQARVKRGVGDAKEAVALEKAAQRLFRTAVEMDGDNPAARLRLAEGLAAQGRFRDAGLHYAQALRTEPDFDVVLKILDRLSGPDGKEMIGKSPDAFSFVGFALKDAGRHPEAALIFHRAAQAATEAGQHKKSLAFTEQELLAQEATAPYVAAFSGESNPVAKALYGALRDAGIPSALMDGVSGREGDAPDRKITAAEVFAYLDAHQGDARVQKALKKIRFEIPWQDAKGGLKKEFDTPEFAALSLAGRMAHWHAGEASRLQKAGPEGDAVLLEKHLRMASYYEPENAARQTALGEFYTARQDATRAKEAYLAAVAADPANVELQKPLAQALAAAGDFKSALTAYDAYLKAHPGDAATQKLRAEAEHGYQGILRQDFDAELQRFHSLAQVNPGEALKSLKTLETMAGQLESFRGAEPLDRYQNLKRAETFYQAVVNLEAAHESYDKETVWKAQSRLREEIGEAATAVRDSLKVPEDGRPTRVQVERAQAFIALQFSGKGENLSLGIAEDLKTLAALIQDVPSREMGDAEREAALDGLLQSFGKLRQYYGRSLGDRDGTTSQTMHDVAGQVLDAAFGHKDSADKEIAQELVYRILDDGERKLLPFLSAAGLKDYVGKSHAADQAFAEAQKIGDVREKRGALLTAMGDFAKLGDEKRVEAALTELRATVDDKMSDADKLQIETAAYLALRGSGLPQEKSLLDASKLRALKMSVLHDTSSPKADVQRLLLLKSYYDTVEDATGSRVINAELQKSRDALLNFLNFGKPADGLKVPTDAKERLELASLSVQIDQALLADDISGRLSQLPVESRTALYTSRLEIWRKELAKAQDLPYAERLEQARMLAQSAAVYRGLSEGEGAFLDKGKVDAGLKAIEETVAPVLAEYFAQDAEAPEAQKRLAEKITQDLQSRFHAALQQGDSAWLAGALTSESILRFGELAQNGHILLAEAASARGPQAVELRLKASALFIELGLSDRVKESLGPVEDFALKMGNPRQKIGLLLTVTQGYQQVGLKKEANAALQRVVDMDSPQAPAEVRELATLARGMLQLNNGELAKAQETLAAIPKNPTAQLMLAKLSEGTQQRRMRMTFDALAPVLFSEFQGKRTELSEKETAEIRDKVQATLQKWQQQLASGELRSLDDAFRRDMGGFYFESFEGAVAKSFVSRISNPDMTDEEFSQALLGFSRGMLRAEKYGAAMGIAQLLEKDPYVAAGAKAVLEDIPGQARWDGILKSLKNMTIIFAESDEEALKSAAIMLVSFGVGRVLAVGAEAAWVARAATFIRSPIALRASTFAVKTTAEAAGFTLGSMTMETVWSGKTSHWNLKHFGTEFGSMLVTFVLLHGVGMGMQGVSAASARYVGRAEAGMARALEGGGGLGAAAFELRLAKGMDAVAKSGVTAWGTRVMAFTGTEYVNEAIGLRPKENVPFWVRLAGSAVMDAQMMMAGKTVNAISGGRIAKIEKASQMKLAQHKMDYQAKELLPIVQRMGFDAKTPAGRAVWESLMRSRAQGESLKAIESRTGAEEMARYDKIVAEQFGLDPKSPRGRNAKAALLGYAQIHPFAEPGKPLGAAELAGIAGRLHGEATKLLTEAGIERGGSFDALRDGLLGFALQTGLEPAHLGEYAAQAKALKAPLTSLANQILGPDAARTPEGQALMGELAVYAMFRASAPEKLAAPLESLGAGQWGAEAQAVLRARAEALLGKVGVETPAGRAWMAKLFLRTLHESAQPGDILPGLKAQEAGGEFLPMLADVAGFTKPKQRLALATWALEAGVTSEAVKGLVNMVLKGQIELRFEGERLTATRVPEGEQAAKSKEVLDRLPELPSEWLREDLVATRRAEEEILPITEDMVVSVEPLGAEAKLGDRDLGVANFVPITAVEAKADKIAKAKPDAARLARYAEYIKKKEGLTQAEAEAKALEWAEQVILDARTKQLKQTHIYDTSLPARPETQHLDKATIDHHGRFGNPKNATEQLLERLEATLETVKADPKALKAAKADAGAMKAAGGDPVVAAALRELNLRQVTTDNLADGGWCVWIAKNQTRVLADPALRKLIGEATHFEDFTAFGTEYNPKDPGVRLQAALFQRYGEILQQHGIVGADRFPPEKAGQVMGEAVAAIDKMLADPTAREAAASEFFAKVESGREKAAAQALIPEASVHEGETNLSFFDLSKLGDFTVFQQWLSLPRVEPKAGSPDTLQVSVVPMKAATAADGASVPRTLQIVAIPNGRELPSGKGLLSVLERINAAEKAKAEKLGVEPNQWFGKDNVILPNPAKGGTVLTTREVSEILTSPELGLFRAETNVLPMKKPAGGEKTVVEKKSPQVAQEEVTKPGKKLPAPEKSEASEEATVPGIKAPLAARKGATAKPFDGAPKLDRGEGPTPLSPKDGVAIPEVEIRSDGESKVLSFEAGKVLPLGVQGGKLVVGEKAKSPLAEVEVMWTPEGEIGFYLRRSGKSERQRLRPGDKVSLGDASFVWEGERSDGRPKLKLVPREPTEKLAGPAAKPAKGEAPVAAQTEAEFRAFVESGRSEAIDLLKVVEQAGAETSGEGGQWLSSFANLSTPTQAHVPIVGRWSHLDFHDFGFAYRHNELKDTPVSTYEVTVHGKQRLADVEARLQETYGARLMPLTPGKGSKSEWMLRGADGQAQILIKLQPGALEIPTPQQARETFKGFEGEQLATLSEWAKEPNTLRSVYALRMLIMIGYEADGKGGTRFGTKFEATLARYEKSTDSAEKARAGEELATMVAHLKDAVALVPEHQLVQDAYQLQATSRPVKAAAWASEQPGPLGERGKEAVAAVLSLSEKTQRVRMLGDAMRRTELEGDQKVETIQEYRQAVAELEAALRMVREVEAKALEQKVDLDKVVAKIKLPEPRLPAGEDSGKTEVTEVTEVTKKAGAPKAAEGQAPLGKIEWSPTEFSANAFLDFYFGEHNAFATVEALANRSPGSARDHYADMAFDFRGPLQGLRAKMERYNELERVFHDRRQEALKFEGKDPPKAAEAKRQAEAAIQERAALEGEIRVSLAELKASPYNQLALRYNERIDKTEKELIPLEFALTAAEVEATIAARGTGEKPALVYGIRFKPMTELADRHFDNEFKSLPANEFVQAEVSVTQWKAAERAVEQMVEEGVLRPEQKPDFAALAAEGAREVTVRAEIPGVGEIPVVFRFEGEAAAAPKAEKPASPIGKTGTTAVAVFLGITTLLTPELAHAADTSVADGSAVPLLLGAGAAAALAVTGVSAFLLWARGRSPAKADAPIRQRRGSAADKIPPGKPLVDTAPPVAKQGPVPASQPVLKPVPPPAAPLAPRIAPVPGSIKAALGDNVKGRARQGAFGNPVPTVEYGSFSVRTGEGIGYKKHHNEDGFVQGRNWGLVLDGMGGMGSGDKASEVAGKKFAEEMALHGDMARAMAAAGDAVNASPYASGGAVAVAHQILPLPGGGHVARIVHVGDAGAIVFRKNAQGEFELVHRTEEQSVAAEARRTGHLRDTLAMRASDFANVVSGGLGTGRKADPVVKDVPLQEGDVILSFSDGVGDNVSRAELNQILKESRSADEVQAKVWELVHWKMQRLALVKDIFYGDAKEGGVIRDFIDAEGHARQGVELSETPGYFIDKKGHVYDSNGVLVDHYKADNVTIHAYVHDVAKAPPPPAVEKTVVMPALRPAAVDPAEAKTQVYQIPQPWTAPTGEWILPKHFGSATLGRDAGQGAKLQLGLAEISSRHAEFFESEGDVWVRDRGSLNGTWVNGRRLQGDEACSLSQGDIVTFGTRSYLVGTASRGNMSLTPVLSVSSQQPGFQWGPVTVYRAETGAYAIRNDGSPNLLVGGKPLPADGNAYRIRNLETIQVDGRNFAFVEFP